MIISIVHSLSTKIAIFPCFEEKTLSLAAKSFDEKLSGFLSKSLANAVFKGKKGEVLTLSSPHDDFSHIILIGLGKHDALKKADHMAFGANALKPLRELKAKSASLFASDVDGAGAAFGALLKSWQFDKYKTKKRDDVELKLETLQIVSSDVAKDTKAFEEFQAVAKGVFLTRELISEPANIIYPETLTARIQELSALGVTVEVLNEAEMTKLGMGALLGVGQGSIRESQLVVMTYNGAGNDSAPLAFVGKGVTFDTGGISLKPADGMEDMIFDMGGAGAVVGLLAALAGRKAKANVVGVVGLVENMPSGAAQRPGDIVTTMSGQTIEVLNTDAEGRLVLADALWYTKERFHPTHIVDLATLTGAILVALGVEYAGLFSNDDDLSEKLLQASKATGEKLWRMPLDEAYDKDIDTDRADMKNTGNGRYGGSITAAKLLQRFVGDTKWAHLDIAGTVWLKKDSTFAVKGATGFGVRLLDEFVRGFEA